MSVRGSNFSGNRGGFGNHKRVGRFGSDRNTDGFEGFWMQGGFGGDGNGRVSGGRRPNFGDRRPSSFESLQTQRVGSELGSGLKKLQWETTSLIPFSKDFYTPRDEIVDRPLYEVEAYCSEQQISDRDIETPKPGQSFEEGKFPFYIVDEIRRSGFSAPTSAQAEMDQIKPKSLSGAQRRRLLKERVKQEGKKWFPKKLWREINGLPPKTPKAAPSQRKEGTLTPSTSNTGSKRTREEPFTATPSLEFQPAQKKQRQEEGNQTFNSRGSLFSMAVIHQGYPLAMLTSQHQEMIQMALLQKIGGEPGQGPSFRRSYLDKGALIFVCEGVNSVEWLKEMVPKISPWEEAKLLVKTAAELFQTAKISIQVPELLQDSPSKALIKKIQAQNRNVPTEGWVIVNRSPDGQTLVVEVGEKSLKALREQHLKLYLGFSQVAIKVIKDISYK